MLDIFRGLKNLIKVSHVHIDSTIFRLHYTFTVMCLLAFSLIVTTRQYVGNPIDCVHTKDIPEDVLNTYCWIHSTYTIPSAFWKRIGIDVAHPGIDKTVDPEERRYVKYYQWVCFCLFFQAILFYIPRWLWKNWEAGKIQALMMDLDLGIISEVEKRQKKKLLLDYLYSNLKNHNFWAYRYFFCELLALINVIGQLLLLDRFLDGTFLTFGIEVISFALRDNEDRVDPLIYVFPRMTKCTFHKFGTSGTIETHDALCILPINIFNEKIYIFLWFWLLALGCLTALVNIFRLLIIVSPRVRAYLLYLRFRLIKQECINLIIRKTQLGDWFLLYMLGQNIDSMVFKEIIHELARKLGYQQTLFWLRLDEEGGKLGKGRIELLQFVVAVEDRLGEKRREEGVKERQRRRERKSDRDRRRQMFLLDRFFDGTFLTFGIEVMSFADRDQEDRIDPMVYIFPRMTKCTFHKFGTSGEIEKHDALCILPLNIFNEKIYIFLWFWMLSLGALTFLVVVYRVLIIFSGGFRSYLLKIRYRRVKNECIEIIMDKTVVGDWFLLYLLGQNVDPVIFKDVLHELAKKLGYRSKDMIDT
ncbi:hypothetical protein TCAL_05994 [Tigriopus californicus]|uniref:Innexin n=1 Tax=Tigriopus californicus TaxID=6832 RepID=A0A553PND8_TIGCA|nr:hypothetical protein TCAL_05994 [Tigriopus californicus]